MFFDIDANEIQRSVRSQPFVFLPGGQSDETVTGEVAIDLIIAKIIIISTIFQMSVSRSTWREATPTRGEWPEKARVGAEPTTLQ